eukprot:6709076-Ditylum_brightwellii.AAC.1
MRYGKERSSTRVLGKGEIVSDRSSARESLCDIINNEQEGMGRNDGMRDIVCKSTWKGRDCPQDIVSNRLSARESPHDIINNQQEGMGRNDRVRDIVRKSTWKGRDCPQDI